MCVCPSLNKAFEAAYILFVRFQGMYNVQYIDLDYKKGCVIFYLVLCGYFHFLTPTNMIDTIIKKNFFSSDVLLGSTEYSTPIDMWGVGCIFYEMSSGRPLFPGSTVEDELHLIFKVNKLFTDFLSKEFNFSGAILIIANLTVI